MKNPTRKTKKVLFFTRPLAPPWDEASKNLAFEIIKNSSEKIESHPLTTTDAECFEKLSTEAKIVPEKIYSSTGFGLVEKIKLLLRLYRIPLRADIVHFLFTPRSLTSLLLRLRLLFSKAKTVQTVATLSDELIAQKRRLKKILFADKIVVQSKTTKQKLEQQGFGKLELVYPGIDLRKFYPQSKNSDLLRYFGLSKQDFVLLFAGEYTRLKAIDDIISALEIISKKAPGVKTILACRIKSRKDKVKKKLIQAKVEELGISDDVIFLDTFANMAGLYNISDVNIFPVREMKGKFDIPLAVVEAMACKKPVIVSDIPYLEEFVKNNENGLVVPKKNPEKLAEAILELKNNPEKLERLGNNAQKFARENFDIKKVAKKYEEIYLSL